MLILLVEAQLPGIIIAYIISWQVAIYFIYTYFKYKDKNLGLNKILLAFGLLYAFGFTGVFLRTINSYYLTDVSIKDPLDDISHVILIIGTLLFQIIVSSKDFNQVLNIKISKSLILLNIFFSFMIFISHDIFIRSILIFSADAVGLIYIVFFNLRLIKLTYGNIKRRLLYIMAGEVIFLLTLLIGSEEVLNFISVIYHEPYLVILMFLQILGLIIVILGIYDFPAFLEFEWRKNLITLYIFNEENFELLFHFDFRSYFENSNADTLIEPHNDSKMLIALGGIKGIEKIFANITNSASKKINIIAHGDVTILLEYTDIGSHSIIFLLMIQKDMKSIHYFLQMIIEKFVSTYETIFTHLTNLIGDKSIFFTYFNKFIIPLLE